MVDLQAICVIDINSQKLKKFFSYFISSSGRTSWLMLKQNLESSSALKMSPVTEDEASPSPRTFFCHSVMKNTMT